MSEDATDYYLSDRHLSPEENAVMEKVRRFVEESCMPAIAEHYDKGRFPEEAASGLAEMGLFGVHVDGYGCEKQSHTIYGLVCRELGRCDSGLRAMFSVQNSLVMVPIHQYGSEEQRLKWLPLLAEGKAIGCFGLSEPGYGSDPGGMATRAEKSEHGYVLSGRKMWITLGPIADLAVVWAKTESDEIRGFLVETDNPGLKITELKRKFAYRTVPTGLLVFDNCEIPEENLLPEAIGLKSIFRCLNSARFGVACGALGSAIACYEAALQFASKRIVHGKPIASYQLVQERLTNMLTEITKARLLTDHLGRLMDEGLARPPMISMAKLNNVREAMKIARTARDILGARGILADHAVIRHLCGFGGSQRPGRDRKRPHAGRRQGHHRNIGVLTVFRFNPPAGSGPGPPDIR